MVQLIHGDVVATIANKLKRASGGLFKQLALAAALGACSVASAGVLTFDGPNNLDSPFIFGNTEYHFNGYTVETRAGTGTAFDYAGQLIDGNDPFGCDIGCPINNKTNYLALLDDAYVFINLDSNAPFRLSRISASFIGNGQASFGSVAGILQLQGFSNTLGAIGGVAQINLAGPTNGSFNFTNYNLGAFSNNLIDYVRIVGFACDATGSCTRAAGLSNFAIDNVTIPEPGSVTLLGLAAAGLIAARRRRAA